jgi:hypothetical protein
MSDDAEATQDASTQAEPEVAQTAPAETAAAPGVAEAPPDSVETQPAPADAAPTQPAPAPLPVAGAEAPAPAKPASARYGRTRSVAVGLVFFLTCLSLVLATTTWWLHDTLLDTDHFVALTAPLASDPAVQEALVEATTKQIDEALGLGPIGSYVVTGIAREAYSSDAFAQLWERAMAFVHEQLVRLLRNEGSVVQTSDGQVVLNLFPLLDRVFDRINELSIEIAGNAITAPTLTDPSDADASRAELSAAIGRELKPTFGVIVVADAPKLEAAQRYVTLFDALLVILFIVTGLLALLTLVLARRRIRMVALLGLGVLAALLVARLVIASAADGLATAVAGAGPGAIIGGQVVQEIADSYREFARIVLLIGLAAAVGATAAAWRLERRASAESSSGGLASLADGWFLALAGLTVALASLLVIGLTMLTLVIVVGAYIVWLAVVAWSRRREAAAATA